MNKVTRNTQKFINNPSLWDQIPAQVTWTADNYTHLHEQPVIFYALMFYISLTGQADLVYLYLAWAYVILRVLHSFVQISQNKARVRFGIFATSATLLTIMVCRATLAIFRIVC